MMSPVPAPAAPAPLVSMAAANAVQPNEPLAMRTQAMPATCGRSGRPRLEPASHEAGPAARAPRRSGGDGRPAAAHAADFRFPHDVHHPAAKKADAVVDISFARLNRAASAREPFNSAIASPADCLVSAATAAPVLSRQRRSVSGAPPGSLATCSTALASDEHEPRDSANSPTAFALNSGVHPVPFAMVPSSPIEPGETRNKEQFISPCPLRRPC